ncbi:MAG: hypothetical protein IKK10_04880 [Clostridia bacterium]|nr:hypothetical protein [Clostridia bacterium]
MNCPNCGGLLDLKNRHCEYCNTNFTEAELFPEKVKAVHNETKAEVEPESQKKLTMTEQRQLELAEEKAKRKATPDPEYSRDIATGAAVMGIFGLFSGIRRFFRELKRVVCFILLIALEIGFGYLMISGKITELFKGDIESFAAVNGVILVNALLAGLICRIGRIRVCTALVGIVSCLAVIWVYVYPLITTNFEGVTAKYVAILAVVEMAVLALSVLLAHLIYRR